MLFSIHQVVCTVANFHLIKYLSNCGRTPTVLNGFECVYAINQPIIIEPMHVPFRPRLRFTRINHLSSATGQPQVTLMARNSHVQDEKSNSGHYQPFRVGYALLNVKNRFVVATYGNIYPVRQTWILF